MDKIELERRTSRFVVDVIYFVQTFSPSCASEVVSKQVIRAAGAIGANYREANRAESGKDFAHHLARVIKEAAESEYWLGVSVAAKLGNAAVGESLAAEALELLKIFSAARRTTLAKLKRQSKTKKTSKLAKMEGNEQAIEQSQNRTIEQ